MDVKPIPLTPRAAGPDRSAEAARTQAMEKAEREFHAMLLREMLRPLTQALFGNENGFSGAGGPLSSGNETYAYFLEQALSQQLAEGWQLPSPFGSPPSPARPDPFAGARPNPSAVAAPGSRGVADGPGRPAPLSLRGAPIPLASAATPGEPIPISADPPARTSRLPGSLASSATRYSRSGSAAHVPVEPSATDAPRYSRSGSSSFSIDSVTSSRSADELDLATTSADPDTRAAQATASRGGDSPRGGASSRVGVALPDAEIRRAARLFDLPENLVRAVVLTESGGRADALSPKGAVGYMQVMPSTGKEMGASDLRDPWQNLYAGAKYLRKQLDRFGNLEHALAAYNAGPGAVERHGGIPPYRETREYVRRVFSWMNRFDRPGS